MKKGIELEYYTVDASGRLADAEKITGELDFAAPEFARCVTEIKSEPHEELEDLKNGLEQKTREAILHARKHDLRLVPLGTPLNHNGVELLGSERLEMMRKFNPRDIEIEEELLRAGTHIHFEKKNVKDQLNVLTALDPAFALLNASPYHQGERTASSSRNWIYRHSWEPRFPDSVSLWPYVNSVDEWRERMHDAFEKFKNGALDAGVPEDRFMDHHHPDRSTWNPIRLRNQFPTVEYRSPDATLPGEVLKFAEDLEKIVEKTQERKLVTGGEPRIDQEKIVLPGFDKVREMSRRAAKKGPEEVGNYLKQMGFDTEKYDPMTEKINGKKELSLEEARELRLQAADMLEDDVGV